MKTHSVLGPRKYCSRFFLVRLKAVSCGKEASGMSALELFFNARGWKLGLMPVVSAFSISEKRLRISLKSLRSDGTRYMLNKIFGNLHNTLISPYCLNMFCMGLL